MRLARLVSSAVAGAALVAALTSTAALAAGRRGTGVAGELDSVHGYGDYVKIDQGNGLITLCGHMAALAAQPGEKVVPGTVLGKSGDTGFSTGPHLHFEVRQDGQTKDP